MDYYFLIITIVDTFTLGIMCVLTKYNETLTMHQRRWLIASFILIIVISIMELGSVIVDNTPAKFRWVSILVNYLGFGLTPAVPVFLSCVLGENKINKPLIIAELVYMVLLAASIPFGAIFYVDSDNQYMRGDFFGVYIAVYSITTIYLLVSTVRTVREYQSRSKNSIYLIFAFLLAYTMIQVEFPQIHISWLCVSLLAIVYSVYCNIVWQQLDGLTGLLNQNSYLNKIESLERDTVLMVFDIDDFKKINDTHGHPIGDEALREIAACIKNAYSKNGLCYRIGGDEFCVLLSTDADKEACDRALIDELEDRRKQLDILPNVSFGAALFTSGDSINKVKKLADSNMYQMKKEHKTAQSTQA